MSRSPSCGELEIIEEEGARMSGGTPGGGGIGFIDEFSWPVIDDRKAEGGGSD